MAGNGVFSQGRCAALSLIIFIFTVIVPQPPARAANVTVQWDPSPDPNVVGYNFYYGVANRTYTNIINVGNATTVTVSNLMAGTTYYFAATAYNLLGTESVFSDELSYTVTVPGNTPPTLNTIGNLTLSEDAAAQTVNLSGLSSGSASETQTLTVTSTSSNPGLIPNPTVSYTSPSATGTLSFTPVANANGTATITVTVNDGQLPNNTLTRTFTVTVNPVNDSPTLNTLGNLTINEDATAQTVNLAGIGTGSGNETQTLAVRATSSNPGLIPNPTVSYTSPNATGTLSFTPVAHANGTTTITVTANDGQAQNNSVTRAFTVTVNAVNDSPTLNAIGNLTLNENSGLQTVALAGIGTGAANESQTLAVTATSSNPGLIPNPTVSYTSPNATGSLAFTPVAGASGSATITVTVNDGQAQNNAVTRTFTVTVNAANRLPFISAMTNVIIAQDTATPAIPFTIGDVETAASSLTLQASSTNLAIVLESGITFGGSGSNRTVTITPLPGFGGETDITIAVGDGTATASTTFHLSVQGQPAPPSALTVVTSGEGTVAGLPAPQYVKAGQVYALTAVAGEGQMFVGWSGSTNTPAATLVVRASSNLVLRANFVPLNLTTNGSGAVLPNLKKTRNLLPGRPYTITAMGGPGNMFVGWTGSTSSPSPRLSFIMRSNLNLQANFVPVSLSVNGSGTIAPDLRRLPNLIPGRLYTISARPGLGQEFAGWTGTTNSESTLLRVVMNTNLSLQANFVPSPYIPIAGNYYGLFYGNDAVRRHSSGYFYVNVTARGTYSGWLQTAISRHAFYGKLKLDLRATNVINRPLNAPLTLELSFGSGAEIDRVAGRLVEPTWTANLSGDRAVFNVRANPAPFAGSYTLLLPGQAGNASLPAGDGFGTLRVLTSGMGVFGGTLGDGARVTQAAWLSKQGNWPLYSVLYYGAARGALLGWMNFANRPNDDLNGTLSWIKPANALNRFYPSGFDSESQAVGSIYRMPVNPQTNYVLNLTNAEVSFSGGNLDAGFSNSVLFGSYSRVSNLSSNRLTLAFSTALGTYYGTVVDPATQKYFTFRGAVLQKQNAGYGLLTGTNQTSRVVIAQP